VWTRSTAPPSFATCVARSLGKPELLARMYLPLVAPVTAARDALGEGATGLGLSGEQAAIASVLISSAMGQERWFNWTSRWLLGGCRASLRAMPAATRSAASYGQN
jgi:hypothetical protein